jgi:presenilin-like A22 family membrane protease
MKYLKSFLLLVAIYVLIQGLGLWLAGGGLWVTEGYVEQIKENPDQGVVQNPESPEAAGQLFLYILFGTGLLLLLIKYHLELAMKVAINVAIFGGLWLTLGRIINLFATDIYLGADLGSMTVTLGCLFAVALFLLRLWKPENAMLMNFVLICTVPAIGTWLGASLGLIPALLFLIGLAVYDVVAVFGTKHMVTLAENSKSNMPLMFAIPVGERTLGLGTGDLTIPLMFTASLLRQYPLTTSIIAAAGGLIGLTALFIYTTTKKDVILPALPPIAAGLLLGYGLSLML